MTGSLQIPEFISYRPRGICTQAKCMDCLSEPCSVPSRYLKWIPKLPNVVTPLSAVWHSPNSERLHAIEPLIKQLLAPQLVGWRAGATDSESVVLHFRCSDSPMNLHWGCVSPSTRCVFLCRIHSLNPHCTLCAFMTTLFVPPWPLRFEL